MLHLRGRWGRSTSAAIAALALLAAPAAAQGLVWSYASDGSWQAETVSLGGSGGQVFTEMGSFSHTRRLFSAQDQNPPAPVWTDAESAVNFARKVDSADEADVHAAMVQIYADSQSTFRTAVLRKHSAAAGPPDWTYEFPTPILNHFHSDVAVSADGATIVGAVFDSATQGTRVAAFGPDSSVPVADFDAPTFGAFQGWALSADGSTAVFVSSLKLTAVDVATGAPRLEEFLFGEVVYGALALSGDGSLLAYGTLGEVRVYERGPGGDYQVLFAQALPAGHYPRSLAFSRDGALLAMGLNVSGQPATARMRAIETATQQVVVDHVFAGTGSQMNSVEEVAVSADGGVIALGLWGDGGTTIPEVSVFEPGQNAPTWTQDLIGSVIDLDLSPDGTRLAVASKGAHATDWGGAGSIALFSTCERDFDLEGVPHTGSTVTFRVDVRPGGRARVLWAPALAGTPTVFAGVGTLVLDRPSMLFLPGVSFGDAEGSARIDLDLPNDPALVGTTSYYQGLGLAPRRLTDDWVRMTVLP